METTMPELTGSEKQVNFANGLRSDRLASLAAWENKTLEQYASDAEMKEFALKMSGVVRDELACIRSASTIISTTQRSINFDSRFTSFVKTQRMDPFAGFGKW